MRDHLEAAADNGDLKAAAALDEPELPEEIAYLVTWVYALYQRSGIGMDGPAPLSYTTIDAWSRLTNTPVEPHEIEALLILDDAMRHPQEKPEVSETRAVSHTDNWPTRKNGHSGDGHRKTRTRS